MIKKKTNKKKVLDRYIRAGCKVMEGVTSQIECGPLVPSVLGMVGEGLDRVLTIVEQWDSIGAWQNTLKQTVWKR